MTKERFEITDRLTTLPKKQAGPVPAGYSSWHEFYQKRMQDHFLKRDSKRGAREHAAAMERLRRQAALERSNA